MRGNRPALLLLERVCAVIVVLGVLYAAFLPLIADHEVLLIAYRRGGLTPSIIIIVGACAGWLCLRLARSRQRPPIVLAVAGLCAVGLLTVMWWGIPGAVEKQDVTPPPDTGRFYDSQPPGNAPGTVTPSAPPSARP